MKAYQISNNTALLRFGEPYNTQAVIRTGKPSLVDQRIFNIEEGDHSILIRRDLDTDDVLYGLGQNTGGINKKGKYFVSYCTDDFSHTEEKKSLYGVHPFLIFNSPSQKFPFGLFIDFPGEMFFDLGFTDSKLMEVKIPSSNADIYLFQADTEEEIVSEYLMLTGKSYIPPKWAFGYQQCRWSYMSSKEVDSVIDNLRAEDIPCDAVYLDIDYMDGYRDFTVDSEKFPDFEPWIKSCRKKGIHIVPIIDAGVKIDSNYQVYQEGVDKNYFCKKENGEDFVAAVWPGLCHFPDFLNQEVRHWWGDLYKKLMELGIDGFWNDMNEPALFYTPERLGAMIEAFNKVEGNDLQVEEFFPLSALSRELANNREDYRSFYHKGDDGKLVNHDQCHNIYGYFMTMAASEGFKRNSPEKRILMYSRASYAGAHRYGGIWNGDNTSWWSHILLNIQMSTSLNLSGFLYSGADTGGFGGDCSADLLIRWFQFSVFTPLFRNHSALGTRKQEPYNWNSETQEILRNIVKFRYALIPYLYSEFIQASDRYQPFIKPLSFYYREDPRAVGIEDQILVGHSFMATPVYTQNAKGRYVYLPEEMLFLRVSSDTEILASVMDEGDHFIDIPLNEFPLFVRKNRMFPLGESMSYVGEKEVKVLTIIAFADFHAEYHFYDDDGESIPRKNICRALFTVDKNGGHYAVSVRVEEGELPVSSVIFKIYDSSGNCTRKSIAIKG